MRGFLAVMTFGISVAAQDLTLASIKTRMSDNLRRQPNYTCLETIERTRQTLGQNSRVEDRLRVEVALVEGKEIFSLPGSSAFENTELRDLITSGLSESGNYGLHARSIFLSSAPVFGPRATVSRNGRTLLHYNFRIAQLLSDYRIKIGTHDEIVGYHGAFFADPDTLDIQRIEIALDDIPSYFGLTSVEDAVTYGRVKIGDNEFLLPVESELTLLSTNQENRNHTRFSSCHQYSAESTITFVDVITEKASAESVEEVQIPSGLPLTLLLTGQIDLSRAAVGDALEAELRDDVKDQRRILVPKGARARGRITRLERHDDHVVLGVTFQELEWAGRRTHIKPALDHAAGIAEPRWNSQLRPIYDPRPGEGLILLRVEPLRPYRGIVTFWRT